MSEPNDALSRPMAQSAVKPSSQDPAYPPPSVPLAPAGTLAPMKALPDGIEVRVSYLTMTNTDVIALLFNGVDTFVPQKGNDQGTVSFKVSASYIGAALGEEIVVKYSINAQGTVIRSQELNLTILPLMEGDFEMPTVLQSTKGELGVLDLSTFSGNADIKIDAWPFIKVGQTAWLDMTVSGVTEPILSAHTVTLADIPNGITSPIQRASMERIPDGSEIAFSSKVQLDTSGTTDGAINLPILELILRHHGGESGNIDETFGNYEIGELPNPLATRNMTFMGPGGLQIIDNNGSLCLVAHTDLNQPTFTITLNEVYEKVTLDIGILGSGGADLRCHYKNGRVYETIVCTLALTTYEFTQEEITSFEVAARIEGPIKIFIDNVRLYKYVK